VATAVVVVGKMVWAEVLVKATPNKTRESERRICDTYSGGKGTIGEEDDGGKFYCR
jgi:hypothetical protein